MNLNERPKPSFDPREALASAAITVGAILFLVASWWFV